MEIVTQTEFQMRAEEFCEKIKAGVVFIYPTDTVYGIGCNALNTKSVEFIRKLKNRPTQPFSIWVPSKQWIEQNCSLNSKSKSALEKIPGPYTILLPLKNKKVISPNVNDNLAKVGIRLPQHWLHAYIEKMNIPIVTTSVNKHSNPFMTSLENLDPDFERVEFCLYEGPKEGRPSVILDPENDEKKER
ncbi:L-threonylcarbamoyladenylate synthase [Candidatus Woesearchaeota archaeon]|nr:L-threonylcarbamoyladenylate synthase [Candidatus Woesearchaeota archaeon]